MNADALLAAIHDAPDDDVPRLVYADWLEEHGDEKDRAHAELIRVQIERARLPIDDDRCAELDARQERLRWRLAFVERMGFPRWCGWDTVRGFPEMLQHSEQQWQPTEPDLEVMSRMVDRLPLRGIAAQLSREGLERVAGWPTLARLTCLEATLGFEPNTDEVFAPALESLSRSAYAGNLRRLRLGAWQYDPESMTSLADSLNLGQLTDLELGGYDNEETSLALACLCFSALGRRLECLNLAWVDALSPREIRRLLDVAKLRELHFGVPEDSDGVRPLLGSDGLSRLRRLEVTGEDHGFGVDELPYPDDHRPIPRLNDLLASPQLADLEQLSLRGVMLGDDGARALVAGPMARNLVRLRLDLCGLTGDGLRALRPLLAEGRIRSLSLEHNVFSYEDALELASWPELARLHRLSLGYFNRVGDEGRAALEASPHRHPHSRYG